MRPRTTDMRNDVTITGDRLIVEPRRLDKLWGLRRRIEVPLAQVRGATYDPGAFYAAKGLRAPGLALPNVKWVGTFYRDGQRTYWNVRRGGETVVIELDPAAPFARLYLSVDDGRALVDRVNAAVVGGPRAPPRVARGTARCLVAVRRVREQQLVAELLEIPEGNRLRHTCGDLRAV